MTIQDRRFLCSRTWWISSTWWKPGVDWLISTAFPQVQKEIAVFLRRLVLFRFVTQGSPECPPGVDHDQNSELGIQCFSVAAHGALFLSWRFQLPMR